MADTIRVLGKLAKRATGVTTTPVEVHEFGWAGWGHWAADFGHIPGGTQPMGSYGGAWDLGAYLYQRVGGARRVFHWGEGLDNTLNRGVRGRGGATRGQAGGRGTGGQHEEGRRLHRRRVRGVRRGIVRPRSGPRRPWPRLVRATLWAPRPRRRGQGGGRVGVDGRPRRAGWEARGVHGLVCVLDCLCRWQPSDRTREQLLRRVSSVRLVDIGTCVSVPGLEPTEEGRLAQVVA